MARGISRGFLIDGGFHFCFGYQGLTYLLECVVDVKAEFACPNAFEHRLSLFCSNLSD
jgi:hypothetical protein